MFEEESDVAVERAGVEDAALPAVEPVLAMLNTLVDIIDEVVAFAAARSDACHLICTLNAFSPSFTFVKLVVVVVVPASSVATIVIGPSDTNVPIAAAHP